MSLAIEEFPKLWMLLDDAIKNRKVTQIKHTLFGRKPCEFCINGLFFDYAGGHGVNYSNYAKHRGSYNDFLKKYNITNDGINYISGNLETIADHTRKTGKLDLSNLVLMNNLGYTFEQFRDLFKEMDA